MERMDGGFKKYFRLEPTRYDARLDMKGRVGHVQWASITWSGKSIIHRVVLTRVPK